MRKGTQSLHALWAHHSPGRARWLTSLEVLQTHPSVLFWRCDYTGVADDITGHGQVSSLSPLPIGGVEAEYRTGSFDLLITWLAPLATSSHT